MGNYMPTGSGEAGTPVDVVDDSLHHHKPSNREALKAATLARQQSYQRTDSVDRVENSRDSQFTTPEERGHRKHIRNIDYKKYEYKFDNIVFEGGGAKGIVYVGVLEVLEEVGVKPKRYAGASAGAMVAALAAVGYSSSEIREVLELDLEELLLDHSWGYLSLLPNLLNHFGWNPGNKLTDKFGELIEAKLDNPDITFKQLYDQTKVELCIIAVNVNMMRAEYFHVKTTPNVPIKIAVRMSMSIPGVFQPVPLKTNADTTDYYVDGGVLCNYPIHAFDGWWLSMKHEDSFLKKIQPLSDFSKFIDTDVRFKERNDQTIGVIVYSAREQDVMRAKLEGRVGLEITDKMRPNTKLFKERREDVVGKNNAAEHHEIFLEAMGRFIKALNDVEGLNGNEDDVTTKDELKTVLNDVVPVTDYNPEASQFNSFDIRILFGDNHNLDEIFSMLDPNHTGTVTYGSLIRFISHAGVNINTKYQGYDRQQINKLGQFFSVLTSSWMTNTTKMYLKADDFNRTIGINCDYIDTMDFSLEEEDRKFAIQQGRNSTIAFLKHFIFNNKDKVKEKV